MTTETSLSCPGCGTSVVGGARFCLQCGGAVTGPSRTSGARVAVPDQLLEQLTQATLGEYRIQSELGRGGMAAVYLAEDLALGRPVAIKVMIPGLAGTDGMAERFLLEARTAAQLGHPHIIPIYAVRTTGQLRYFAMKYIAGRSLDRVLAETGPLPVAVVQAVLAQVGSALEHAHRRGVVHRDIKPANIILDEDGTAIVADFGIAKVSQGVSHTHSGATVGTPTYMSPEQCTGKVVTGASDQYSLGCVAFELLAGRPPFAHEEVVPVLLAHVSELPPPLLPLRPDCPIELAAAIDKMLAKDPNERWPSLAEAIAAADSAHFGVDVSVRQHMRELSGAGAMVVAPPVPSVPVSPLPRSHPPGAAQATVRVARVPLDRLWIPAFPGIWQVGDRRLLSAVALDQAGAVLPQRTLRWTSLDPAMASVDQDGMVHARGAGQVRIRVEAEGQSVETVIEVRGTSGELTIVPGEGALAVGQVVRLAALLREDGGRLQPATDAGWSSSDPTVLRIAGDGEVTALRPGTAAIRVAAVGQEVEVSFQVTRVDVAEVRVTPRIATLGVGEAVRLAAQATDRLGTILHGRVVTWSTTHPERASVGPDGVLLGLTPGTVRVGAAIGEGLAWMELRVTPASVHGVKLEPAALVLRVGESAVVHATVQTIRGGSVAGLPVEWQSSDPVVAAVTPDGIVSGVRFGLARIAATAGGRRSTISVEVRASGSVSSPRLFLGST